MTGGIGRPVAGWGPHHDPSPRYVDNPDPSPGDVVTVSVDLGDAEIGDAWLRTMRDGEQEWVAADRDGRWLRFELSCDQPVVNYRFHLETSDGPRWLTGAGLIDWDPGDRDDFRLLTTGGAPDWVGERVWYQIFPDRFARNGDDLVLPEWAWESAWDDPIATGPAAMTQIYGGDLDGIRRRLDHLVDLGVGGIYLTPVFPARSNHRYDATTFDRVDQLLGGDRALIELSGEAHRRGLRIMTDLTLNHTGDHHDWFLAAQDDPRSVEAGFYYFTDHPDSYESWLDVPTLPKLDHRSTELRHRLHQGPDSIVVRYLTPPFAVDGWRIDVANMTGRLGAIDLNHEVAHQARATVNAVGDRWLVAEHFFDASLDAPGDGWHGVMNYAGVTKPLVSWLGRFEKLSAFTAGPGLSPRNGVQAARAMDVVRASLPWSVTMGSLSLMGSHDTVRWRTMATDDEVALMGFGLLLCLPGTPMLFYGDEIGLTGANSEQARAPMPWDEQRWNRRFLDWYRTMISIRNAHPALRAGGFRWVDAGPDALVFCRESPDERLLIRAARAATGPVAVDLGSDATRLEPVLNADPVAAADGAGGRLFTLPSDGPLLSIWSMR